MGGADDLFGGEQTIPTSGADDLFSGEEQQRENSLKFIADGTVNETPERASRSIEIMKRTGISKKFIDDNFDELDKAAKQSEFDARDFLQKSPKVADWMLKNPDYATLIKEDRDSMTAMESIITTEANARRYGEAKASRGPGPSIGSVLSGIGTSFTEGFAKAKAGTQLQFSDVIGSERMFTQASRAYEQSVGRELRATPEINDTLGRWVYGGAKSVARMVPSIAAAVITKNPSVGLAVIGGEMQPEAYAKYRTRGGTPGEALLGSAAETTVEIAMEKIPMGFVVDNLGKAGMGTFLRGFLGRELPTELVAEISQSAIDTSIANPDKTWNEFVAELPDTIGQTVTATLMMAGGLTLTNEALKRAAGKEQGPMTEEFIKAIGENSTNSKLRERLPDSYQEIVKEITKDGPVENVYAPVEFFQSHFQDQNIDPRKLATELGIDRQYDEAINTGGKIAIPLDIYAKNLAPTEHNAVFAKELSFGPDQMSSRETEDFLKESEKEKEPEVDTFGESLEQAMTPIREQLKAIYPADIADKNAAVIEARLRSRATRLGIDPQELMKQRPLEITEGGEDTGSELMQAQKQTETPEFTKWFGESKVVDESGKPVVVYHGTSRDITEFNTKGGPGKSFDTGAFFSASHKIADTYTGGIGGSTVPVYLSMKTPVVVDAQGKNWNSITQGAPVELPGVEISDQADEDLLAALEDRQSQQGVTKKTKAKKTKVRDLFSGEWDYPDDTTSTDDLARWARRNGYDGLVVKNVVDQGPTGIFASDESKTPNTMYVAFRPEQIKSAIGNRGTFDPSDPNILYQAEHAEPSVDEIVKILKQHPLIKLKEKVKRAFVIGSYARGEVDKQLPYRSDIDIMLEVEPKEGITSEELSDKYRQKIRDYFVKHNIREQKDDVHPQWDGRRVDVYFTYDADKDILPKRELASILKQEGQDIKRGSISVSPTGDVIRLFQAKNLSTLLHELSHRWLLEMQDDAALPNAPHQIKDDLAATLKYLGVESVEELDITKIPKGTAAYKKAVAANEKFAETGEAYLMEGKAPSSALRRVFSQIRAWLVAVYKALKQGRLTGELTDEMRGVFDRLLATDEEIAQAKAEANAVPIFTTAVDAGMTDTEFAAYRKTIETANREEREELDAKVMREYKKTLTEMYKEEKAKVQAEVEAELDFDPIYSAMRKMQENNIRIASSEAGALPKSFTAKDGIPADMAAEMLGFTSGEALVKSLSSVEPRGSRVRRETSIRMDHRFGNLLTDGTLIEEARKAVMGNARAKIIEAEIRALNNKANEVKPFVKAKDKANKEEARAGRDLYKALVPKLADVRAHAASVISGKPIRELRPMQYYNAARQASREAVKDVGKKDYLMAGYNKGRELLNLELYREANNAIDAVENNRKYLQKFDKESSRKKMRGEFLVQIDDILERFDLRKRTNKAIDEEKQSLVDFIEKEAERLSAVVPDIAPVILNERYRKNYKEMTVEELVGVVAAVKQLETLARREHEQYMAIRKMNFEQERTSIIDRMREFNPDKFDKEGDPKPIEPVFVPNVSDAAKKLGDKFSGEFLNTETILNLLEGGSFGQVEQSLFGRMSERSNWRSSRLEGIYKKLKPIFDQYSFVDKRAFARNDIGIGMTRENAVVVALLNGNKEGRERLNNYGWDEAKIHQIISHLDQRDFNLVNGIWEVFDQDLWPELKELNERTRGSAPPKVEAVPYQTRFGEQKGGYFKLIYDTELDERAHHFDETKAVKDLLGGSMGMSAKTSQGSSNARKDGVKLRPRLDLNVFSEAVNETVHDLAYREAVADSMKLLNDPDIRDSIKSIAGTPAYRALVTRVRETAAPPRNPSGFIEKALTIARKNTIVTLLSGVRTALLNVTGAVSVYSRSFEKSSPVSAGLLTREYGKFFTHKMVERYEFCVNNSEYMKHRFNNFDRDLQDQANKLTVRGNILPDTGQWLWLMKMTDRAVTVPVWNATFAEGMKRYNNDTKQAVEYADHIVRQTQGSGRDVDLAKIMSGHGGWGQLKKVFTMFQSFFNGQLGQLVRAGAISAREAQDNKAEAVAKFTARFILIVSIPAAIATIGGRDDDDMDENWFKKFVYTNVMYIAAMFPLVRDMAAYTWAKFDKSVANYGLKLSPVQSAGEGIAKGAVATRDIVKGEGTKKDVKDVIMGTSFALGLPGKLISDVVLGTNAYLDGDKGPQAIIFGPGSIRE